MVGLARNVGCPICVLKNRKNFLPEEKFDFEYNQKEPDWRGV
jgi:hypothetical protein